MRRFLKAIVVLAGVVVILVAAMGAWLWTTSFDALKPVIVSRLEAATGRTVAAAGAFSLRPGLRPTLVIENVAIANAEWGSRADMIRADRIEVTLQVIPLTRGDVRIDRLLLVRPHVLLEKKNGRRNWRFREGEVGEKSRAAEAAEPPPEPPPQIAAGRFLLEQVALTDGVLTYRSDTLARDLVLNVHRFGWRSEDITERLDIAGAGRFRGQPWDVVGTVGSIADLLARGDPYPVELKGHLGDAAASVSGRLGTTTPDNQKAALKIAVRGDDLAALGGIVELELPDIGPYSVGATLRDAAGTLTAEEIEAVAGDRRTEVRLSGRIGALPEMRGLDLRVAVHGEDLDRLGALAGIRLGAAGAYRAEANLSGNAGKFALTDLTASLGDNTVRGRADVVLRAGKPPSVSLALDSDRLDLTPMLPERASRDGGERAVFRHDMLAGLDTTVKLRVSETVLGNVRLEGVRVDGTITAGRMQLEPVVFGIAGGWLEGSFSLDTAKPVPAVNLSLNAEAFALERLLALLGAPNTVTGLSMIALHARTEGASVEALLRALDGSASFVMTRGRILDTQLNWLVADFDIVNLLPPFWRSADSIPVNCLVGRTDVIGGIGETALLLDTDRMRLNGTGIIDLPAGRIDLALRPEPKDQKLSSIAVPVRVRGPLDNPEVISGDVVGRAAVGLLGGLMLPINLFSSLFGDGDDGGATCRNAIQQFARDTIGK